jgi:hypothetical protein
MSEYQYYEFQAVDRPLTDKEQAELRKLSTRAEISAYRFSNVYHWGNFKGSPEEMMERYFDAHVYVANWGTRRLMLRLPRRLFDPQRVSPYLVRDRVFPRTKGDHVILNIEVDLEEPDWVVGEGWLASLLPLRAELLSGDFRGLYLAWLACARAGDLSEKDEEPPVPPGLGSLSAALRALTDFLGIPSDLVETAAQASPEAEARVSRKELEAWIHALPASEKEALLFRLMDGTEPLLGMELLQRFQAGRVSDAVHVSTPRRSVGELLRAAEEFRGQRKQRESERQAAARAKELDALATRESAAWEQVEQLFATRSARDHATGVRLLVDLREVAQRRGTEAEFIRKLSQLRERNARRAGLMSRLDREGLSAP